MQLPIPSIMYLQYYSTGDVLNSTGQEFLELCFVD